MPLNQPQVAFVNTSRIVVERLILLRSQLDAFVLDYDNQQTPLPTTAVPLDDKPDGGGPRTDVPTITGADIQSLRNFCFNMRNQINDAALAALIKVSHRDVESILRNQF